MEQDRGYGTEAAELGLMYAFDDRGLEKVSARVLEGNERSKRNPKSLGFQKEGHLLDHYYIDGEPLDAHLYALLAADR